MNKNIQLLEYCQDDFYDIIGGNYTRRVGIGTRRPRRPSVHLPLLYIIHLCKGRRPEGGVCPVPEFSGNSMMKSTPGDPESVAIRYERSREEIHLRSLGQVDKKREKRWIRNFGVGFFQLEWKIIIRFLDYASIPCLLPKVIHLVLSGKASIISSSNFFIRLGQVPSKSYSHAPISGAAPQ